MTQLDARWASHSASLAWRKKNDSPSYVDPGFLCGRLFGRGQVRTLTPGFGEIYIGILINMIALPMMGILIFVSSQWRKLSRKARIRQA